MTVSGSMGSGIHVEGKARASFADMVLSGNAEAISLFDGTVSVAGVLTRSAYCKPDQRGVARSVPCDLGAYEDP